jgi:hypothetical protein
MKLGFLQLDVSFGTGVKEAKSERLCQIFILGRMPLPKDWRS